MLGTLLELYKYDFSEFDPENVGDNPYFEMIEFLL